MKILVTGGAGFMGSHLVDYLINEGHDVTIIDNLFGGYNENINKSANFIQGDLTNRKDCENAVKGQDIVYHLAAHAAEGQSVFCPIFNTNVNYIGFLELVRAVINEGIGKFVFTSSMAVYGKKPKLPMREDMLREPEDPYGIAKAACERILEIYRSVFGLDYVIIRPHNVYGPRQNLCDPYRNVIGIFMNRIMKGKPPIIYGDGIQTRAFTYIDDCTPYIAKAGFTKKAYGEIINIGNETPTTIKDLADIVLKAMDSKIKPEYAPARPQEVKHAYCSSEKARKLLGYETSTPIEVGVKKMAEWAKSIGPKTCKYWDRFEITRNAPDVWINKKI